MGALEVMNFFPFRKREEKISTVWLKNFVFEFINYYESGKLFNLKHRISLMLKSLLLWNHNKDFYSSVDERSGKKSLCNYPLSFVKHTVHFNAKHCIDFTYDRIAFDVQTRVKMIKPREFNNLLVLSFERKMKWNLGRLIRSANMKLERVQRRLLLSLIKKPNSDYGLCKCLRK